MEKQPPQNKHLKASYIWLIPVKKRESYLVDINPSILLKGDVQRLIDEWQIAPKLWDVVRFEVDKRSGEGQFILTGSAVPADNKKYDTVWIGEPTGEVSLKEKFDGKQIQVE